MGECSDEIDSLFREFQQPIFLYFYQRTGDREFSDDMTQEVFLRAHVAIKSGSGSRTNVKAWLYRIARNSHIDHYRQSKRRLAPLDIEAFLDFADTETVDDCYERACIVQSISQSLAELSPTRRDVVAMRLDGYSYTEIGEQLGLPVGTVKSQLSRGFDTMAKLLRQEGVKGTEAINGNDESVAC